MSWIQALLTFIVGGSHCGPVVGTSSGAIDSHKCIVISGYSKPQKPWGLSDRRQFCKCCAMLRLKFHPLVLSKRRPRRVFNRPLFPEQLTWGAIELTLVLKVSKRGAPAMAKNRQWQFSQEESCHMTCASTTTLKRARWRKQVGGSKMIQHSKSWHV